MTSPPRPRTLPGPSDRGDAVTTPLRESPFKTSDEAATYLCFPSVKAFHDFRRTHRFPVGSRMGKSYRFHVADLDDAADRMRDDGGRRLRALRGGRR